MIGLAAAVTALFAVVPAAEAYIYWGHFAYQKGVGRAALDRSGANESFIPAAPGQYANSRGVASDGTNVFWGADDPYQAARVGRAAVDGSNPNYSFTGATGFTITGMALSPTHIYWSADNQDTSEIGRTPIQGGQQFQSFGSVFGDPHPHACGVAVDDTYVYWANRTTSTIGRASLAHFGEAGNADGNWIKLGNRVMPCGIAVDANYVYWGVYEEIAPGASTPSPGTTLGRAKKVDGSAATNAFVGGANMVSGVAIDGSFIYWSNFANYAVGGGSIGRADLTGNGVDPTFVSGLSSPFGVAVDAAGPTPAPTFTNPQLPIPARPFPVYQPGGSAAPVFDSVQSSHDVWAPAKGSTAIDASAGRPVPRGTVFSFVLSRAAKVKIAIRRATSGRRAGRRCRATTRRLRRKPRCVRLVTVVTLTRRARAGLNKVPFTGRIRGRALAPARYTAVFTAKAGAASSRATTVRFRVVRP